MSKVTSKSAKGDVARLLDGVGIDAICEMLEQDMSVVEIAAKLGCSEGSIRHWLLADPTRSARARDSRIASADACDAKALAILAALPDDASQGAIVRAREMASHLRWRAKARNPAIYGEKVEVETNLNVTHQTIAQRLDAINSRRMIDVTPPDQSRLMAQE
jgi:hypothetical protein